MEVSQMRSQKRNLQKKKEKKDNQSNTPFSLGHRSWKGADGEQRMEGLVYSDFRLFTSKDHFR